MKDWKFKKKKEDKFVGFRYGRVRKKTDEEFKRTENIIFAIPIELKQKANEAFAQYGGKSKSEWGAELIREGLKSVASKRQFIS